MKTLLAKFLTVKSQLGMMELPEQKNALIKIFLNYYLTWDTHVTLWGIKIIRL